MKEQLKRELNKTYLIISSEGVEYEESYEIEMILQNVPKTLLPLHVLRIDGALELYYDVSSRQTLKDCAGRAKISTDVIRKLFEAIDELIREMKDLLLDMESVRLDLSHIYTKEGKFYFCYCPWEREETVNSFRKLLEELLGELDYHDTEGVELAYHLYQSACKGNFQLSEILKEHSKETEKEALPKEDYEAYFVKADAPAEEFLPEPKKERKKREKKGLLRRILDFFLKKQEPEWHMDEEVFSDEDSTYGFFENKSFDASGTQMLKSAEANTVLLNEIPTGSWKLRPLMPGYQEFSVTEESFLVGKSKYSVDGYIGRDTVSRIHSRLVVRDGRLFIADANSTNGTFVNAVPVEPGTEVEILPGDRILFADVGYECYNER